MDIYNFKFHKSFYRFSLSGTGILTLLNLKSKVEIKSKTSFYNVCFDVNLKKNVANSKIWSQRFVPYNFWFLKNEKKKTSISRELMNFWLKKPRFLPIYYYTNDF